MHDSLDILLSIAQIVPVTEAEGPGIRFALWFQGCPLRCPGCCNPEMLPFTGGNPTTIREVLQQIDHARQQGIEGVTLLGGEPVAHAASAVFLAREIKARGLTLMAFTGYTLEEIHTMPDPAVTELISHLDILVDGPYLRELPDSTRRWIGSTNQRIHFLSDRYEFDAHWRKANTLEIRLQGGELTVNGFPGRSAVGLWKRPRTTRPLPVIQRDTQEGNEPLANSDSR